MYFLCDTCSILMLLRINPEMFIEEKFNCYTIPQVVQEFTRTPKFKELYPWKDTLKVKISSIGSTQLQNPNLQENLVLINFLLDNTINKKTDRLFNLSYVDKNVAACCITYDFIAATEDKNLKTFLEQEFDAKTASVLKIINDWIEEGLLTWDDNKQLLMAEWVKDNEAPQPKSEISRFTKLTQYKYLGT